MPTRPHDLNVAMGRAIRSAAARSDTLHSSLARRLGIHQTSMSRKMKGENAFTWHELVLASDAMEIDLAEIVADAEAIAAKVAAAADTQTQVCNVDGAA